MRLAHEAPLPPGSHVSSHDLPSAFMFANCVPWPLLSPGGSGVQVRLGIRIGFSPDQAGMRLGWSGPASCTPADDEVARISTATCTKSLRHILDILADHGPFVKAVSCPLPRGCEQVRAIRSSEQ